MSKRLKDVRDLPERLQEDLLVVRGRCFEGGKRRLTVGLSHTAIEDGLRNTRCDAPHQAGGTEKSPPFSEEPETPAERVICG